MSGITVTFEEVTERFAFQFYERNETFETEFQDLYLERRQRYSGAYTVTPEVTQQVLETAEKVMEEDLVVKAIPYFEVSNEAGGSTVYIGNEV